MAAFSKCPVNKPQSSSGAFPIAERKGRVAITLLHIIRIKWRAPDLPARKIPSYVGLCRYPGLCAQRSPECIQKCSFPNRNFLVNTTQMCERST